MSEKVLEQRIAEFRERGYTIFEGAYDAGQMQAWKDRYDDMVRRNTPPGAPEPRLRVTSALEQEPGGHLHEAGGEAHRFGRVEHRGHARQDLGGLTADAVEIARGFLDQTHALGVQGLELRRRRNMASEADGIQSSFGHGLIPVERTTCR